jgi:lipid II:glycine glycyltransferase (peptidoglycan interpeptide bridge formation enzyme)
LDEWTNEMDWRGFVKRATISEEKRNGTLEQKAVVTQQIKELVQEKKEIDESLKYVRDAARAQKKELETEEKEYPMASRAIGAVIEQDYFKKAQWSQPSCTGSKVKHPSSTTRSLKACQKRLQESI